MSTFLTPTNPPVPTSNPKSGRMAGGGRGAAQSSGKQGTQKQNLRVLTEAMWDKVLSVVGRVDVVAHAMEIKWGIGRLHLLVPEEWCLKFLSQQRKFHNAVHHGSPADVEVEGGRMQAAWEYLDRLATEAGRLPLNSPQGASPVVEGVTEDGTVMMVVCGPKEAHRLAKWRDEAGDTRNVQIWAIEEIMGLLKHQPQMQAVQKLKETFGEAVVSGMRIPTQEAHSAFILDDEIPF